MKAVVYDRYASYGLIQFVAQARRSRDLAEASTFGEVQGYLKKDWAAYVLHEVVLEVSMRRFDVHCLLVRIGEDARRSQGCRFETGAKLRTNELRQILGRKARVQS